MGVSCLNASVMMLQHSIPFSVDRPLAVTVCMSTHMVVMGERRGTEPELHASTFRPSSERNQKISADWSASSLPLNTFNSGIEWVASHPRLFCQGGWRVGTVTGVT